MSTSSYPGMAQSFTMSHGTNMSTVAGMRQDAMGKRPQLEIACLQTRKLKNI